MEKIVKVFLIDTPLKTVQNNYLVIPETKERYDLEKVINRMKSKVPFMDKAFMAIVIRTFNEQVIELTSEGYHVNTELVHFRPVITGTVPSSRTTLKDCQLKIVANPCKALRTAAAKTKLRVSRRNYQNRCIHYAINPVDHKEPFIEKGIVLLHGRNLKVMGNFPECGVWLECKETRVKYQVTNNRIYQNKPKTLMFQLPDELTAGSYYVSVVTCYCGTKRLLSKPTTLPNRELIEVFPAE